MNRRRLVWGPAGARLALHSRAPLIRDSRHRLRVEARSRLRLAPGYSRSTDAELVHDWPKGSPVEGRPWHKIDPHRQRVSPARLVYSNSTVRAADSKWHRGQARPRMPQSVNMAQPAGSDPDRTLPSNVFALSAVELDSRSIRSGKTGSLSSPSECKVRRGVKRDRQVTASAGNAGEFDGSQHPSRTVTHYLMAAAPASATR